MPTYAEMAKLYPEMESIVGVKIKKKRRLDEEVWIQAAAPNTNCWYIDHPETPVGASECVIATIAITEYDKQGLLSDCNSNPESWYYNAAVKRLYVHTSGSDDPGSGIYYIMSLIEERVATDETEIGGQKYQGLVQSANIPDIDTSISGLQQGTVVQTFGEIVINNDGHYDTDLYDYIYEAAEVDVYMVGIAREITSDVLTLWTGWTGKIEWTDLQVRIAIEDLRKAIP